MRTSFIKGAIGILILICGFTAKANHLVGGDFSYKNTGNGKYEFTITIYRDCNSSTLLDDSAIITIFNNDNGTFKVYYAEQVQLVSITSQFGPCVQNPPDICLEKGVYKFVANLASNVKGYLAVFQRCCRNSTIVNIDDPSTIGSTYDIAIPGTLLSAVNNSSPVFNNVPPSFLCANSKLDFDFSATDPDGDSLVYALCPSQAGADQSDPRPGQAQSPPYFSVPYASGFSSSAPLGITSIIRIDPHTGLLTAIPKTVGQFVVGICVTEYRNGKQINKTVRDFQFNVAACAITSSIPAVVLNSTNAIYQLDDTTYSSCNGLTVNFDNRSSGAITSNFWDFGDPSRTDDTSILKNPVYTFADTGIYHVKLIVNRGQSCGDTSTMELRVYKELKGNFTFIPSCVNKSVPFVDSSKSYYNDIVGWKWFFGDGDSAISQNPNHLYTNPGTYNVSLIASTQKGCNVKSTKSVIVFPGPNADFILKQVCYDIRTLFTNTSTINGVGTITNYYWDFGNGIKDSVSVNPTTTYPSNNNYNVQLIAVSNNGCRDTTVKNISIIDSLKPNFTFPLSNCQKSAVQFTNTSTGNYTGYLWNFRDSLNSTSAATNPAFTYTKDGNYLVMLTVNHAICGKDSIVKSITIKPQPLVTLTKNINFCNGSTATLSVPSIYDSLRWNTNETTNAIIVTGSVNPIKINVYKNGCTNSDATTLVVNPKPNADFSLKQVCYGIRALFTNQSTVASGTIPKYYWDLGNGSTDSVSVNPTTTYPANNNYNVQLIAVSDKGCSDTTIKNISIIDSLKPDFTFPASNCQLSPVQFTNISTGNYTGYAWNFRDSLNSTSTAANPSFTYPKDGNYSVMLTVNHAICGKDSIKKNVIVKPKPIITLIKNISLCNGSTTSITVPSIYDSLRWNTNETTNAITVNGSVNPISIMVFKNGCSGSDATTLVIKPKPDASFATDKYCSNKPTTFLNTSTVGSPDSITQNNWNINSGSFTSTQKDPVFNLNTIMNYDVQLIVTTNSNCKDTFSNTLSLRDTFIPDLIIPGAVCEKSAAQFLDNSKGENIQYTWLFGDGQSSSDKDPFHTYTTPGSYTIHLTIQNKNCGKDSVSGTFDVKPLPVITLDENVIMCPDEQRSIQAAGDFDSVFWSTGSTTNPTIIDGNTSPVIFTGFKSGCKSSDSIMVLLNCDIYIPTAFSPNSDGLNDLYNFMPLNILSYDLRIYDRWGELVFETTDSSKSWDGTYKGQTCPMDNYVYYATGVKKDNKTFVIKGTLTLLK